MLREVVFVRDYNVGITQDETLMVADGGLLML